MDRLIKLDEYKAIEALDCIIIVDPSRIEAGFWYRDALRMWRNARFQQADSVIEMPALGIAISLAARPLGGRCSAVSGCRSAQPISSALLQAKASGAKVVGFAKATRAWTARFAKRMGVPPTMVQAANYSAALHWMRAVQAVSNLDGNAVAAKMHEMPVNDFIATMRRYSPTVRVLLPICPQRRRRTNGISTNQSPTSPAVPQSRCPEPKVRPPDSAPTARFQPDDDRLLQTSG